MGAHHKVSALAHLTTQEHRTAARNSAASACRSRSAGGVRMSGRAIVGRRQAECYTGHKGVSQGDAGAADETAAVADCCAVGAITCWGIAKIC